MNSNEIRELKKEIAKTAARLMDLLDNCPDLDFVDDVVEAVKYNEDYRIRNYL